MVQIVAATFKDGVFKPDQQPALSESARVRLVVEPLDGDESAHRAESWAALRKLWNTSTFNSNGDRLKRDQLHDRRLLYSVDRNEPTKQRVAQQLLEQLQASPEPTVLLWQVLGELTQQLRRWRDLGRFTPDEFAQHVRAFRHVFPLALPTAATFDAAMSLSERFSFSRWDSMILAACQTAGVTRLFTEDMGAPRKIDEIGLINPFA